MKYRWKLKPYHHQRDAVKFLLKNKFTDVEGRVTGRGGALLMDPRTGKTKVVVDYASILHMAGRVSRVLIVAPVNALGVWQEEIETNCPFPHTVTVWDKKARKNGDLPKYGGRTLDFVIVNYDAFSTPGRIRRDRKGRVMRNDDGEVMRSRNRGGRFEARKKIMFWQPDLIVLDESHRIKSASARKSFAMHKFHDLAFYRVLATGTVVTKKKRIFDVYSQWKFLHVWRFLNELGHPMTLAEFKEMFAQFKNTRTATGHTYPRYLGNRNEDMLHEMVHRDAFSIRREDCFDLPPHTIQMIHFELEESAEAYDQMAEDMVARIRTGEITEASIRLVQSIRLRQITNGVARTMPTTERPEGRLVAIGWEKLRMLESRLEDLFEAEEKVIIGASFRSDIARIQKLARKMKVPQWTIVGGVKHEERTQIRRAFERHRGPGLFIGNPAAASESIDLASSSIMIWYSLPTSWVHFHQFRDRNALSERPTFEEVFQASPMDELQWETLMQDQDLGRKMITAPERLLRD